MKHEQISIDANRVIGHMRNKIAELQDEVFFLQALVDQLQEGEGYVNGERTEATIDRA